MLLLAQALQGPSLQEAAAAAEVTQRKEPATTQLAAAAHTPACTHHLSSLSKALQAWPAHLWSHKTPQQ
jgi:hypothetical protein